MCRRHAHVSCLMQSGPRMFFRLRDPGGGFPPRDGTVFCRREPTPIFVSNSKDKHGDKISVCLAEKELILSYVSFNFHQRVYSHYSFLF